MSPTPSTVVHFSSYGDPADVLREERIEVADPPPARVRVRVAAVGLNPADWALCRGLMAGNLPRGIGYDVAGVVDAVGDGVADVREGDRVFGTADFAGQPSAGVAEVAILDSWYSVPEGLELADAATLPMAVQTAVWTLDAMDIKPESTLLVSGAGTVVGFAAVQIALRKGARVVATAGPTFSDQLESMGALVTSYDKGMAERVRELAGGPVDNVFDASPPAAGSMRELLSTVEDPARVMTISNHSDARQMGARVNLDHLGRRVPASNFMPEYAQLAADDQFRIPISRTYPLSAWRDGVRLSMSGQPYGKVILVP